MALLHTVQTFDILEKLVVRGHHREDLTTTNKSSIEINGHDRSDNTALTMPTMSWDDRAAYSEHPALREAQMKRTEQLTPMAR